MSLVCSSSSSGSSSSGSSSSSSSSSSDDSGSSGEANVVSTKDEKQPQQQQQRNANVSVAAAAAAETNIKTQAQANQRATRRKSAEFKAAASKPQAIEVAAETTTKYSASATALTKQQRSIAPATTTTTTTATTTITNQQQQSQLQPRTSVISSEDDVPPPPPTTTTAKKTAARPGAATGNAQRRKSSTTSATSAAAATQRGGGKAPPTHVKLQQAKSNTKATTSVKDAHKDMSVFSSAATDDDDDSDKAPAPKDQIKMAATSRLKHLPRSATATSKTQPAKRNMATARGAVNSTAARAPPKSSEDESESDSASASGDDDSSPSSESEEASDSSHSFGSRHRHHPAAVVKMIKGKRAPIKVTQNTRSDSDEEEDNNLASSADKNTKSRRKLTTRSALSTRRSNNNSKQQQLLKNGGSESDSDMATVAGEDERDLDKRSLSKSPAKKPASSKCKVKKEAMGVARSQSPQPPHHQQQAAEKKCPIEGCDSSGHLSGNLDRHFLPEACPIYHNMSASECKERANERKLRNEQRSHKTVTVSASSNRRDSLEVVKMPLPLPPTEQKEFLARIRDSRASFRPLIATAIVSAVAGAGCGGALNIADKVKLEKDCTDEDREPCLSGLVPDYDLQLFREAQALASEKVEHELKDLPVGKGIKYITMGKYKMKVWYQSPYPDDAARLPKMYICEFCLRYQKSETGIKRHAQKCVWRHPPGDEIYRKGKLQVWQVDGKRHKQYCQHLCLLAKFFLDHKTLYYDVEPFLFYIMTLADVDGCHTVGYFSKEKNSFYNVSCILTLPPYQRKGYGRLLIDFSYLLTRVEGKIGSPEKPLSDLGLISYRSYWKDVLLDYLCNRSGNTLSIKDVSQEMAIYSYDIVSTLQALGMMKYWKGKHIVLKKQDVLDEYEERVKRRGNFPKIDENCLRWSPFVPTQATNSP